MCIIESKEIKDMFASYKAVLSIIIGSITPVLLRWRGVEPFSYLYISVMLMALGQYVYDSYTTDTQDKGVLFLYNYNQDIRMCKNSFLGENNRELEHFFHPFSHHPTNIIQHSA